MDIGHIDIAEDLDETRTGRTSSIGGHGSGGSGGRNPGGGGGGDKPSDDGPVETEQFVPNKSRILTGFLLLVVLMTFGGLIAAYIVIATNNVAEWQPFALPIQVWISTVLIVISSVAYHFGKLAIDRGDQPGAKNWFIATTVLGAAFISSQILAWVALTARGLYLQGNPYAGFFYILTAVHAVHVLGGITALSTILLKAWYPTRREEEIARRRTLAQTVGWYWHFMGALWIVIFVLLGFWK